MEDLYLERMNVKTAYLHGDLEEEIYMLQPEDFVEACKEDHACKVEAAFVRAKVDFEAGVHEV